MKRFYSEPEFELVNIRLVADVLGPSQDTPVDETEFGTTGGDDFNPDDWTWE
ncbi:MAG: hypothetical protein Q4A12_02800 [Eubacteriales bacterium]|nr:hypothetical protein [Eubacteriales bacterium]